MTTNNNNENKKVIVFGSTGPIGTHLVEKISKAQPKWQIFAVTRSSPTSSSNNKRFAHLSNVKLIQGDINDKDQALKLSADKDIVYACIGFAKYEAKYWAKHWPIVVDNLLAASSQHPQQKFVFCDNLYAYGPGQDISPTSSVVKAGTKSKPAIRALIRQKLQQRMDKHPESIAVVGGADFFGPLVTNTSFLGDTFTKAIVQGKPQPIAIGSATAIHDFCYAPDFSNALYVASVSDRACGNFWVCPHSIHGKSMQDIANDVARLSSSPKNSKVQVYPGWIVRMVSPFMTFMWEMIEMLPFWSKDYTIDDSSFVKTFGVEATPYEEALLSYIDFYQSMA